MIFRFYWFQIFIFWFCLGSDGLPEALNVCTRYLEDPSLALLICRLKSDTVTAGGARELGQQSRNLLTESKKGIFKILKILCDKSNFLSNFNVFCKFFFCSNPFLNFYFFRLQFEAHRRGDLWLRSVLAWHLGNYNAALLCCNAVPGSDSEEEFEAGQAIRGILFLSKKSIKSHTISSKRIKTHHFLLCRHSVLITTGHWRFERIFTHNCAG